MTPITPQTNDEIFHLMQDELRKVHALGVKIDMAVVGVYKSIATGTWVLQSEPDCSVCAIGADLLGSKGTGWREYAAFAHRHGRSARWGLGYMHGSAPYDDDELRDTPNRAVEGDQYCDGWDQGARIFNWVIGQKAKGNL